MDFKFRSIDDKSPSNFSPPTDLSSRTHIRGFTSPQATDPRDLPWNNNGARDGLQRELEKERIRAEIIAEEIVRRKILEEEVRREMLLGREMAIKRALGFRLTVPMWVEPGLPLLTNVFEGGERSLGVPTCQDFRSPGSGTVVGLQEIRGAVASKVNKERVVLAKPNINSLDLKRKSTTMLGVGAAVEPSSVDSKKPKTKEDWTCALCHVTVTNKQGLNEHLQGKKHKARERRLVTQRTGFGIGPLTNALSSKDSESSLKRHDEASAEKAPGIEDTLPNKKENSLNEEGAKPDKTTPSCKPKKILKYWCEVCQVETCSLKVMNDHKGGRRHLTKLQELNRTDRAALEKTSAQNLVVSEKTGPHVAAEVTKREKEGGAGSKEGSVNDQVLASDGDDCFITTI